MRVLLHDFPGHPFQAELARSLGDRGHQVLHVQCASFTSGKGDLADGRRPNVRFEAISLGERFDKTRLRRRLAHEVRYARAFVRVARAFRPDVIISSNDPLPSKIGSAIYSRSSRSKSVFWLQDIWSIAMTRELARRSRLGGLVGSALQFAERMLLRAADVVVSITPDFGPILDRWNVPADRRVTIENWAPLDELPLRPRENAWTERLALADTFTYLYAGTLGYKHNPDVLHRLALREPDATVVVISEGHGADRLRELDARDPTPNLVVLPFQDWDDMPDILAGADTLLVLLEAEAGTFSVPSKVLTYLCAGRAILAAMPGANLGARTIVDAGAGLVTEPGDDEAFLDAARRLRADEAFRSACSARARRHAEQAFDIRSITDRFELLMGAAPVDVPEPVPAHSV